MKSITLPPAQEAIYSQLFSDNPIRKIYFDQARELLEAQLLIEVKGDLEHEQSLIILQNIEKIMATKDFKKKTKKRVFMVACELMLSRDMGLYDPIAFSLGESEQYFLIYTKIPIEVGDGQFQWLSKLEEFDELFNSFNTMSNKELQKFRLALFMKPYEDVSAQKVFNWIDVVRKCKRPLFYDFQMDSPSECYISIIARVKKK